MRPLIFHIILVVMTVMLFTQRVGFAGEKTVAVPYVTKEKLEQEWNDGKWVNYKKSIYKYLSNGSLVEKTEKLWVKTTWAISYRYTYTYNEQGKQIEELMQDCLIGILFFNQSKNPQPRIF